MSIQPSAVITSATLDSEPIPMMAQVYARVRNRLRELEAILRDQPRVIRTGEDGDEQRSEPKVIEAQAQTLRSVIARAHVVPISERAIVGSTVYVRTQSDSSLERYEIVVPTESDPPAGKVSFDSPIGQALMGRKVDEFAIVKTPRGQRELHVTVINH